MELFKEFTFEPRTACLKCLARRQVWRLHGHSYRVIGAQSKGKSTTSPDGRRFR